jgi:plastocyanin
VDERLPVLVECRPAVPRIKTTPLFAPLCLPALLGVILLGVGCGGGSEDVATGKQLFTQRCGSCHTLADAGTKGTIGPNLDDAFKQDIADGLGRDTVEGVVDEQIKVPQGGQMPANLVKGDDRKAVAAYVAGAVGESGGAIGQLAFKFTKATAKAGTVMLLSENDAPVPHDISIKGGGVDENGKQVTNGGTSKVSVELKAGTYTFYCSVPGHEQAGMKGTLTVK